MFTCPNLHDDNTSTCSIQLSASLGAGLHYDQNEKLRCTLRGKKAYPVASNRFVNFVLKGRCDIDQELNQVSLNIHFFSILVLYYI